MTKYFGTIEVQYMEDVNLIYVFLNNNFLSTTQNKNLGRYSYNNIPSYYLQTLSYNSKKIPKSFLIIQKEEINKQKLNLPDNITLIFAEDLVNTEEFSLIWNVLTKKWFRYLNDPFWYNTFIRVVLICVFQIKKQVNNLIHVEADNIILSRGFKEICDLFKSGEFGYSNEGYFSSAPSFIFLKDSNSSNNLLNMLISLLEHGEQALQPYTGWLSAWITDMAFLDIIYRSKKNYKMLPCLPFGPFSENFQKLQYVFDPTSYGMYIGGSNNSHPPKFIDSNHYVGAALQAGLIEIKFDKVPVILYNEKEIPLFNLHIHNKLAIPKILQRLC